MYNVYYTLCMFKFYNMFTLQTCHQQYHMTQSNNLRIILSFWYNFSIDSPFAFGHKQSYVFQWHIANLFFVFSDFKFSSTKFTSSRTSHYENETNNRDYKTRNCAWLVLLLFTCLILHSILVVAIQYLPIGCWLVSVHMNGETSIVWHVTMTQLLLSFRKI